MPAVLLAIIFLILSGNEKTPYESIATTMSVFYFIIVLVWGGYCAAGAVIEEIQENTWDNIKLSSASPSSVTFGKLLGSTLYTWYGGLIALIIHAIYSLHSFSGSDVAYRVVMLLLTGLFCQAIAFFTSVQSLYAQKTYRRLHTIAYLLIGLFFSSFYYPNAIPDIIKKNSHTHITQWHGFEFDSGLFELVSLCTFLTWSIVAIYRLMREELKFRNIPWVWGLFVAYMMFYISGFITEKNVPALVSLLSSPDGRENVQLFLAFGIGATSTYLMLFADQINITRYRVLWNQIKLKHLTKIGEALPAWIVSLALTIITGIVLCISFDNYDALKQLIPLVVAILLFILRDACILHYFKFSLHNKRAILATIFYLAVLYILIPALLIAAKSPGIAKLFYPVFAVKDGGLILLSISVQLAAISVLLYRRWYKLRPS
jgi:hypothetical protein